MRYYDFPIEEYTNSYFPDAPYYKCTIDGTTYSNAYLEVVVAWRKEMVDTTDYRAQIKVTNDLAMASFMKDVKIKD
tara:strand:- start:64 stop:291 length:228 start_codon:yes stop_codon:yes gene_type:complete